MRKYDIFTLYHLKYVFENNTFIIIWSYSSRFMWYWKMGVNNGNEGKNRSKDVNSERHLRELLL